MQVAASILSLYQARPPPVRPSRSQALLSFSHSKDQGLIYF